MEFRLLGPLEVRAGNGPLRIGGLKQKALLAVLLLHANRVVARDRLIDELWGESPPQTAVKAVQVYVSQLRRLLPEGLLVTRAPGYAIEVEPDAVDLLRFEGLVAAARGAEPARASSLLHEALSLWRGPPLGEFVDEPFARTEAARLDELRLAAVEERIEADLALGRQAEIISELEVLVEASPHRERVRGQLMLALYRAGRQADALAAYQLGREALDELGIEPGGGLRKLEKQILTQDPGLELGRELLPPPRGGQAVLPGPLLPTPRFPFVGRSGELGTLRALLDRAEAGEGGFVLLAGAAGSGKTRLVRELAHEAASRGVVVLYGASDPAVTTPYQPLREWLEFLVRVCDPEVLDGFLGTGAGALARLVPELVRPTAAPTPPPGDPDDGRYRLRSAVIEVLTRMSRAQPLLLVLDDLHWSDLETLHLLRRLARTAPEGRMLFVAAYRDAGHEPDPRLLDTLADLSRLDGVTRLTLGGLGDEEIREFIRGSTNADPSGELSTAIRELTDGTPLLLCELWREALESGTVEVSDAGIHLSRPLAELHGPERVRDLVRERIARLGPVAIGALELAAVAGPRFELLVIAGAAGLGAPEAAAAVEEAARIGLVEELPDTVPAYRFAHELVRRAVYDGIVGLRRAELHLLVGEALERSHATERARVVPELAHHFTAAALVGGAERAVEYNLRASELSIRAAAYDDAAARLSTALELGIAEPGERARVQVQLAYLLKETGRIAEADAILSAAGDRDERGLAAHVLLQRAGLEMFDPSVDPEEVRLAAERTLETFVQLGDQRGLAEAERRMAVAYNRLGNRTASIAVLERALEHAISSGDRPLQRQVIGSLVYGFCEGPTPVAEAIRRCETLRRANHGDRAVGATLSGALSALLAMAGRLDEAREHIRRSTVVLDQLNIVSASWVYRRILADARELLGDRAGAEQDLAATWAKFRELGGDGLDTRGMHAAYALALLYCDEGRWADVERCLAYGSGVGVPDRFTTEAGFRLAAEARLASARGELTRALALGRRAVELSATTDLLNVRARIVLALAEVQRRAGDSMEADASVASAVALYEQKGNVVAAAAARVVEAPIQGQRGRSVGRRARLK